LGLHGAWFVLGGREQLLECGDSLLSPFLSGDDSFSGTQETRKITLLRLSAEA